MVRLREANAKLDQNLDEVLNDFDVENSFFDEEFVHELDEDVSAGVGETFGLELDEEREKALAGVDVIDFCDVLW